MKHGLAWCLIAACSGAPPVGTVTVAHPGAPPPGATRCEPSPTPPLLDPAFAPKLDGAVALVAATGDARLSTMTGILTAWSADSSIVGFADGGAVTLWRTSDGTLVDRISCPGGEIGANAIAMSPDLRWVAVSGYLRQVTSDRPVTCIVDRTARTARMIWDLQDRHGVRDLPEVPPVSFIDPVALSPDGRFVAAGMRNGVVAMWTREVRAIPVAAHHDDWVELLAFSADGRVLATAGKDGLVFLVDTATGSTLGSVTLAADRATLLSWIGDRLVIDTARRFQITVQRRG